MINRGNWKFVKTYLVYRQDVDQLVKESLRLEESRLYHLLRWADDQHFSKAPKIRPTFPKYLLSARIDGNDMLSPIYIQKSMLEYFRLLSVTLSAGIPILEALKLSEACIVNEHIRKKLSQSFRRN